MSQATHRLLVLIMLILLNCQAITFNDPHGGQVGNADFFSQLFTDRK